MSRLALLIGIIAIVGIGILVSFALFSTGSSHTSDNQGNDLVDDAWVGFVARYYVSGRVALSGDEISVHGDLDLYVVFDNDTNPSEALVGFDLRLYSGDRVILRQLYGARLIRDALYSYGTGCFRYLRIAKNYEHRFPYVRNVSNLSIPIFGYFIRGSENLALRIVNKTVKSINASRGIYNLTEYKFIVLVHDRIEYGNEVEREWRQIQASNVSICNTYPPCLITERTVIFDFYKGLNLKLDLTYYLKNTKFFSNTTRIRNFIYSILFREILC